MNEPFNLTLRVIWWMQVTQVFFALLCAIGAYFSIGLILRGVYGFSIIFILLVIFVYIGLANAFSTIKITNERVTVTVFYGRFRIYWDEVTKVIFKPHLIALVGNDKRVVLSLAFAGKQRKKMLDYVNIQIEANNIQFEENESFPITHKNARVKIIGQN